MKKRQTTLIIGTICVLVLTFLTGFIFYRYSILSGIAMSLLWVYALHQLILFPIFETKAEKIILEMEGAYVKSALCNPYLRTRSDGMEKLKSCYFQYGIKVDEYIDTRMRISWLDDMTMANLRSVIKNNTLSQEVWMLIAVRASADFIRSLFLCINDPKEVLYVLACKQIIGRGSVFQETFKVFTMLPKAIIIELIEKGSAESLLGGYDEYSIFEIAAASYPEDSSLRAQALACMTEKTQGKGYGTAAIRGSAYMTSEELKMILENGTDADRNYILFNGYTDRVMSLLEKPFILALLRKYKRIAEYLPNLENLAKNSDYPAEILQFA